MNLWGVIRELILAFVSPPAPQAFIALLEALGTTLPALVANAPLLTAVLQYHVLPGTVIANTTALATAGSVRTLLTGKNLTLSGT